MSKFVPPFSLYHTPILPISSPHTFVYGSDGDDDGVLYFLGTNLGVIPWENPHTAGRCEVIRSGNTEAGTVTDYVDRAASSAHADPFLNQWVAVDLGVGRSLVVSKYSLQARPAGDRAMRNFKLQGTASAASNSVADLEAATWTDIDARVGDTTMPAGSGPAWGTYTVGITPSAYRYLRIINTGVNSTGDNYLIFGEIELYGVFAF